MRGVSLLRTRGWPYGWCTLVQSHGRCMRNEPLVFLSSMEHVARPMYVLKATCCFCRKWCGSDDAHTNKGRESPLRCKWNTPRLVSTMQRQVNRCLAMQLFFFKKKKNVTSRALADHCPRERKTLFFFGAPL